MDADVVVDGIKERLTGRLARLADVRLPDVGTVLDNLAAAASCASHQSPPPF